MRYFVGQKLYFFRKNTDIVCSCTVTAVYGSYFSFSFNNKLYNCEYAYAEGKVYESESDMFHTYQPYPRQTESWAYYFDPDYDGKDYDNYGFASAYQIESDE